MIFHAILLLFCSNDRCSTYMYTVPQCSSLIGIYLEETFINSLPHIYSSDISHAVFGFCSINKKESSCDYLMYEGFWIRV